MYEDFLNRLAAELTQKNYLVTQNPLPAGVDGLLLATSKNMVHIGPIKFKNHTLFMDWDNDLFGRLDMLLSAQKNFSAFVNKDYKVPHGWRMTLPNLSLVALTANGFSKDAIECALNRYFLPFLGGETGQIMLYDLANKYAVCHCPPYYKQYGSIPLEFAVKEVQSLFTTLVPAGTVFRKMPS